MQAMACIDRVDKGLQLGRRGHKCGYLHRWGVQSGVPGFS